MSDTDGEDARAHQPTRGIVVGVDGSMASRAALERAGR